MDVVLETKQLAAAPGRVTDANSPATLYTLETTQLAAAAGRVTSAFSAGTGGTGTSPIGAILDLDFVNARYSKTGVADTLANLVTTTRASGGYADDASGNWTLFGTNVARRTNKGLLVEEARTNSIRNNSMQGAVVGTPGTMPTNWTAGVSNASVNVVAFSSTLGVDYIDLDLVFTASGGSVTLRSEGTTTSVAASAGQSWALSEFLAILFGGGLLTQADLTIAARSAGGANLGQTVTSFLANVGALSRYTATRTLDATAAFVSEGLSFTSNAAGTTRVRIGWPQLELGAFATSPIRTTTVAVSRSADVDGGSIALVPDCTLIAIVRAPAGTSAFGSGIVELNDTTTNNALMIRYGVAGTTIIGIAKKAGVQTSTFPSVVPPSPGTRFAIALSTSAAGANLLSINGGAPATTPFDQVPTSLGSFRLGSTIVTGGILGDFLERVILLPRALNSADTQLAATLSSWGG